MTHPRAPTPSHRKPVTKGQATRALVALLLAAGCGVDVPPAAIGQSIVLDEDTVYRGRLAATTSDGRSLTYGVAAPPAHGVVSLEKPSWIFRYEPFANYHGPDAFTFFVNDGERSSTAPVPITVSPVNDAPVLPAIPDQTLRSGEAGSRLSLGATDVEGDALSYAVLLDDPAVARAELDDSGTLVLAGVDRELTSASTTALVMVSDGKLSALRTVAVKVLPVPPAPPAGLIVEPGDGSVELTWSPSPGAFSYVVHWSADQQATIAEFHTTAGTAQPSWTQSGLTNLTPYRFAVSALGEGGQSAPSAVVATEPGPVPAPVEWAVALGGERADSIHWSVAQEAASYRIYFSGTREALHGRRPSAEFVEAAGPPADVLPPGKPLGLATYYRVIGINGARIGTNGPVAASTVFTALATTVPNVTPALWDVDGDGCLDMVGARGDCQGRFLAEPLDELGLAGLFAPGRVNRDSRLADFTGDGHVDIYTNVYARADDPTSRAILHVNDGTGRFTEDPGIAAMQIGGYGETVVAGDFDNDGFVDIFDPHYWHRDDGGRNWLLMNDGTGHFVDRAVQAGVDQTGHAGHPYVPEAAQALDLNLDGWVDLFVASHLFINNRDGTFSDAAAEVGLPVRFDEGATFADIDQDGDFDYLLNTSRSTLLFRNEEGQFSAAETLEEDPTRFGYGFAVCDVNGDDLPDAVVSRYDPDANLGEPIVLLNVAGTFVRTAARMAPGGYVDLLTCADLDANGQLDLIARWDGHRVLRNAASSPASFRIRLLGSAGEPNQQGRVVHVRPLAAPGRVFARVVESGSGYMAQGGYDILVGAPHPGDYEIAVFQNGRVLLATTAQGQDVTIFADGRVLTGLH